MPKRVLWTCAYCGQYIYSQERCRVRTNPTSGRVEHYHYRPEQGIDCLAEENRAVKSMREMDDDIELHAHLGGERD